MAFKMKGYTPYTKPNDNGLNERQGNKLNKLIDKRKTVHKDSREYVTIQNKINKLKEKESGLEKGTYKRHSKKGKKRSKNIPLEQIKFKHAESKFLLDDAGKPDPHYEDEMKEEPDYDEPTGPKG